MRKAHMQIVIDGLQRRVKDAESQRDQALTALGEKADAVKAEVGKLRGDIKAHGASHAAALTKHGEDLSGLADAVRAAIKPDAAPEPEATPVTPIKRGTKAAG